MSKDMNKGMKAALERMLTTLEKKVDSSHTALIVIDVQNDFCATQGKLGKAGLDLTLIQAKVPKLIDFIEKARGIGLAIIYIQTIYSTENSWYLSDVKLEQEMRREGKHSIESPRCEQGSWGADFYGGVKPLAGEIVVIKHRFSAFIDTELDLILRSKGIRTLILSGTTTNVCVESTARDGFMKDYYIVLLDDCSSAASEESHNSSINNIKLFFGEVVDSSDVLRCWGIK